MLLENSRKCRHFVNISFKPQEETLKSWKTQLQDIIVIASGDYFLETESGYYSVNTSNGALQSCKTRCVRKIARQEINWFSETFRMPSNL